MPLFVHGGLFARVIFNSVSILSHETAENLDVLKNVISLALACLEIVVISLFFIRSVAGILKPWHCQPVTT